MACFWHHPSPIIAILAISQQYNFEVIQVKMRVPAHKLPKQVNKIVRTVKHKDSEKAKARKEKKEEKANGMSIDDDNNNNSTAVELSDREKEIAKMERKKANAHKVDYKKKTLHISGRNGPRAINTKSVTPTHGF